MSPRDATASSPASAAGEPRQVAVVTGAGSGLGLLTAIELARRGMHVFASMRDPRKAGAIAQSAAAAGVEVVVLELDVTSTPSVNAAISRVVAEAGRLDVVVNNAAAITVGPLEFTTDAEVKTVFETNLVGPIRVMRAALPTMRRQRRGRFVNVSSGSAHARGGVRLVTTYAASKSALHTLTLDVNKELAPLGIRAVLVEAGVVGKSNIHDGIMKQVAGFGKPEAPYAVAEAIAASQMRGMTSSPSDGTRAALMIADACTVADPGIRFPADGQRDIDWVEEALGDRDFLKLCALQDVERILARHRFSSRIAWRVTE